MRYHNRVRGSVKARKSLSHWLHLRREIGPEAVPDCLHSIPNTFARDVELVCEALLAAEAEIERLAAYIDRHPFFQGGRQ